MFKLALGIEYDGSSYFGWQKQKNVISIQECIENALYAITSESITVFCAGRTDSGVHALGQVAHFSTFKKRTMSVWTLGLNRYLPSNICVRWASLVSEDFHARTSAIARRYYYIIYNTNIRSAVFFNKMWHYKNFLDIYKMSKASECLLGENDFSAFRASGCQSISSRRILYHLRIFRVGCCVVVDIKANAFIYRMVRNIVGSLVEVGSGRRPEIWMRNLLNGCNRSSAGITAPAHGLYLVEVQYPSYFCIPSNLLNGFWYHMF